MCFSDVTFPAPERWLLKIPCRCLRDYNKGTETAFLRSGQNVFRKVILEYATLLCVWTLTVELITHTCTAMINGDHANNPIPKSESGMDNL